MRPLVAAALALTPSGLALCQSPPKISREPPDLSGEFEIIGRQRQWAVLVQREMECGRSPVTSIARAEAGRVCAAERNGNWHEEAADGNCNWFQKEISLGPRRVNLVHGHHIAEFSPGGSLG
jgi:hypothetical protein